MKLDLGCGETPAAGFEGVDLYTEQAQHKVDLLGTLATDEGWPWESDSVEEIHCSHFFEHVPGPLRGRFMEEVWRVLKPGAKATFITPYWSSVRAIQDPTHAWPPIAEETYLYFDQKWRKLNHLDHPPYPTRCNFEFGRGFSYNGRLAARVQEHKDLAVLTQLNAADDLIVTLLKKPL